VVLLKIINNNFMPYFNLLNPFKVNQSVRNKFSQKIIDSSAPTIDFYFLVIVSTLIVTMGLMDDNVILVIGGMLVTPLLSPLLAVSLGIVIKDGKVIMRSLKILFSSFAFGFIISFFVGLFGGVNVDEISLINKMVPTLFLFLISMVAGVAASYTWVKPELHESLAGIAVTVTLIPPLSAIGLAAAATSWTTFHNTLNLFVLNILGIVISSLIIFSLMDFYKAKKKIAEELKEEEKAIKKAKKEMLKTDSK